MADMELALAPDWKQVAPRETPYDLLMTNQTPGQSLVRFNCSFTKAPVVGHSGGMNSPIGLNPAGDRVYFSLNGITSYSLRGGEPEVFKLPDDFIVTGFLKHMPDRPELVMHAIEMDPGRQRTSGHFIARLNLDDRTFRTERLPPAAFCPEDVNPDVTKVLFSTSSCGAAVYPLTGRIEPLATVYLPDQVIGGAFDVDERNVFLGGRGIVGWNTETGEVSRLSGRGKHPVVHPDGSVWFCLADGVLTRLRGTEKGNDTVIELTGVDAFGGDMASYAQPVSFSPDGRYGLANLTGRTPLTGDALAEREAFARSRGREPRDFDRHAYHHYFCILDLHAHEVWCHEGYAHSTAWVLNDYSSR